MAYWDHNQTPSIGQQVTYTLSQEEYNRRMAGGAASVSANITFVSTATCVNLEWTFNGQTFTEQNVTYDSSGFVQRAWYTTLGAPAPTGSPW